MGEKSKYRVATTKGDFGGWIVLLGEDDFVMRSARTYHDREHLEESAKSLAEDLGLEFEG